MVEETMTDVGKSLLAAAEKVLAGDEPWRVEHLKKLINSEYFSPVEAAVLEGAVGDLIRAHNRILLGEKLIKVLVGELDVSAQTFQSISLSARAEAARVYAETQRIQNQMAGMQNSYNSSVLKSHPHQYIVDKLAQQYEKEQIARGEVKAAQNPAPWIKKFL